MWPFSSGEPEPSSEALLQEEEQKKKEARNKTIVKVAAGVGVLLLLVLIFVFKDALVGAAVAAKDWILDLAKAMGYGAPVLFCFLCWITTAVSGPAFIWEVAAGALYAQMFDMTTAIIVGFVSVGLGVWLGCITVFVLGQKFLKPKVQHVIEENPMLKIINLIIEEEGWQFAFVMRLNPLIPFEALNLACSVTNLSLYHHAIASLGTMPVVCFEVYTAITASALASSEGDTKSEAVEAAAKLSFGILLIIVMAFYAKTKYDKKKAELVAADEVPADAPGRSGSNVSVKNSYLLTKSLTTKSSA